MTQETAVRLLELNTLGSDELRRATGLSAERLDQLRAGDSASVIELCVLAEAIGITRNDMDDDIEVMSIVRSHTPATPGQKLRASLRSMLHLSKYLDDAGVPESG